MKRKVLIVIDMQNDFCKSGGVLYSPDAEAIIPNIVERCKEYDKEDIWFTKDCHDEKSYKETIEGKTLPIHCTYKSENNGRDIVNELLPFVDEECVRGKESFAYDWSYFGWDDLDSIEICGTCTDICVISNALLIRSAFPNVPIIVRSNCCAGLTPEKHEAALKVMESCLIEVVR